MTTDTTYVLVHAAWADSSSWAPVIHRLQRRGHNVIAAPLPLTSFDDDVAALNRVLERLPGPIVLGGHAYAGAVVGAANIDSVTALVYVAAIAPDEGETVASLFHRAPAHRLAPTLEPDRHGLIWLPHSAFAAAFAQDATPEQHAMLAAVQRPPLTIVHHHTCPTARLERSPKLVPHRRKRPHDRRRNPALRRHPDERNHPCR